MKTLKEYIISTRKQSFSCLMASLTLNDHNNINQWREDNLRDEWMDMDEEIPEFSHITIKYGFNFDDYKLIEKYVVGLSPFYVTVKGMSFFNNEKHNVLKLDIESETLIELNARLTKDFKNNLVSTYHDYKPHVTIAYLNKEYEDVYRDIILEDISESIGMIFKIPAIVFSTTGLPKNITFGLV